MTREHWLNGWTRFGGSALCGSGVYCAGCGLSLGVTCVAIPENWIAPASDPDWPFEQADCPVHQPMGREDLPEDLQLARLEIIALRRRLRVCELAART